MDARSRATVRRRPTRSPPCCCSCWPRSSPPARRRPPARARPPSRSRPRRPPPTPTPQPTPDRRPRRPRPPTCPLTLTDDEGTEVTIPAEPTKIASITNAATEILFGLGVGDRVVGKVEEFNPYPAEVADVPDVAKFGSVDVEKIVADGTDLVIAGGSNFNPPESIAKLRSLGVPVLVVFAPDVQTALDDMTLIGQAVGKPDEAAAMTDSIQASFDEVKAATSAWPSRASTTSSTRRTGTSGRHPTTSGPR